MTERNQMSSISKVSDYCGKGKEMELEMDSQCHRISITKRRREETAPCL